MKKTGLFFSILMSLFLVGCGISSVEQAKTPAEETVSTPRVVEVKATRFKYDPSEIRVKQGEDVVLKIIDVDTNHGAVFGNMKVSYNSDETINLDTSIPGVYDFRCATFCGGGHMDMKGTVIVE